MGLLRKIIDYFKEKRKIVNDTCESLISEIDVALQDVQDLFSDETAFVDKNCAVEWGNRYEALFIKLNTSDTKKYKKAKSYKKLKERILKLYLKAKYLKSDIGLHNEKAAELRVKKAYELIGDVEGRKLDKQQMTCIVKDAHNHLVIAGAGTGKTTTVVGKIKYLLKSQKCKPDEILVLSFTNASASEMSVRINRETGCAIDASTFHKLGLNIITKVNGTVPKITQLKMRSFIKEQVDQLMRTDSYMNLLGEYLLFNRVVSKSEFDFKTKAQYDEYLRFNPPTTIKKESVKSYGEMDIANFLNQNGIEYIYEAPYSSDTRTGEYAQYYPDFYLPEYDIYIEYFSVDRNCNVPDYFKGSRGMTASQAYQASMKWKRETHKANNTTMIECYAYEKLEGNLLENLEKKLSAKGVHFNPKDANALWEQISAEGESVLDGIIELFETVINLIKSNGYTIDTVRKLNVNNCNVRSNNLLLTLLEPVFNRYCAYLREHNEIDFNDMINDAARLVREGKYESPYKYVIVDEYQDISKARFLLLHSIRESRDYDLFCVGDDWQSIYRFAGSDIGYILNFEKYWGAAEISKIETTYRFSHKLIEISGNFIMKNPSQIQKSIRGNAYSTEFPLGEISGYTEKNAIEFMAKRLDDLPKNSSVFFIGRYSFDSKLLDECEMFHCYFDNISGFIAVRYKNRPDLKMSFITAHKSKGLQADYVFIINNKKSRMGFPSQIQDAAILELLLDNCDPYPHAEERRLFYVALTRSKKKTFLVTVNRQESSFALELVMRYSGEIRRERWTCPKCGGSLVRRSGPYGDFYGCSNYGKTGCKYIRNIK